MDADGTLRVSVRTAWHRRCPSLRDRMVGAEGCATMQGHQAMKGEKGAPLFCPDMGGSYSDGGTGGRSPKAGGGTSPKS